MCDSNVDLGACALMLYGPASANVDIATSSRREITLKFHRCKVANKEGGMIRIHANCIPLSRCVCVQCASKCTSGVSFAVHRPEHFKAVSASGREGN